MARQGWFGPLRMDDERVPRIRIGGKWIKAEELEDHELNGKTS